MEGDYPVLELGGILNSGWSLKRLGLVLGGMVFIAAGVGAYVTRGKSHSELVKEERKKQRAAMLKLRELGIDIGMDADEPEVPLAAPKSKTHKVQPPPAGQTHDSSLETRMLDMLMRQAVDAQSELRFADAAARYREAAAVLSYSPVQSLDSFAMQMILELIFSASKAYLDAGLPEEAKNTLLQFPVPSGYTETLKLKSNLAGVLIFLGDPSGEPLIQSTIEFAKENEGPNSLAVAFQYCLLARLHKKLGYYSQVESDCQEALRIYDAVHTGSTLSKEHLDAYYQWQKTLILQGYVKRALEIQAEIEKKCNLEDISFNWHLAHIAIAFVESDYDNFAEQYWTKILEKFQDLDKFSHYPKSELDRLRSLVLNSKNELAVMYYNQGRREKYRELSEETRNWRLHTGSKFFDSRVSDINFRLTSQDWEGFFALAISFKDGVEVGMVLQLEISEPDGTKIYTHKHEIDNPYVFIYKSEPRKDFKKTNYEAKLLLYKDSSLEDLLFTHIQMFSCPYDTDSSTTQQQFVTLARQGYRAQ